MRTTIATGRILPRTVLEEYARRKERLAGAIAKLRAGERARIEASRAMRAVREFEEEHRIDPIRGVAK